MGRLAGKSAIVTGAGRGLGREIAKLFAHEGASVAVASRTAAHVDEVVAEIRHAGGTAVGLVCDISRDADIERSVRDTIAAFGGIDVLVNNAHDTRDVNAWAIDVTPEHLHSQMVGATASMRFMQLCQPSMVARGGGRIINMGSAAGVSGSAGLAPYAMAKEAMRALTRCAAREWGKHAITVNTICPLAATEALQAAIESGMANKPVAPLRRYGSPRDDIAPIALFLASDDSRFLTGHTLMADGGLSIDAGR